MGTSVITPVRIAARPGRLLPVLREATTPAEVPNQTQEIHLGLYYHIL
ncbi:MAG: hypothetical protein FWG71_01085 [Synergistaceae bacterium]|nr:hypothetical protein [Synergistaceae bacterium]